MKKNITVIGSSNIDFVMKVPHLPKRGETVTDAKFMQTFGGKGANQAVAAVRAGGNVNFINCLGDDLYTHKLLKGWENDGINIEGVSIYAGYSCGTALVMFDENGENYLSVAPGANYCLTPEIIYKNKYLISSSSLVILQMEIPLESISAVLDICYSNQVNVLFNYAPVRDLSIIIDKRISILVVNECEASALLGNCTVDIKNAKEISHALRVKGPKCILLTLGSKGVFVSSEKYQIHVPAYDVLAVDTTAAGDTFCGAFAVAFTEDKNLLDAVKFANAAAALCVSKMGAQPSIPLRHEIDSFNNKTKKEI